MSLAEIDKMIVGTPGSMAPEQAEGRDDIDTRADVWAIGALLSRIIEICPTVRGRRSRSRRRQVTEKRHRLSRKVGRRTPDMERIAALDAHGAGSRSSNIDVHLSAAGT